MLANRCVRYTWYNRDSIRHSQNKMNCEEPSKSGPKSANQKENVIFLDGIRGAAVLIVVFGHSGYFNHPFPPVASLGVELFFFLSSYLISSQLYSQVIELMDRKRPLWDYLGLLSIYAIRRWFRIIPFFVLVMIAMNYSAIIRTGFKVKGLAVFLNHVIGPFNFYDTLFMRPNARHHMLWSLPIEIAYYYYIPCIVGIAALISRTGKLVPILFGAILFSSVRFTIITHDCCFQTVHELIDEFLIGSYVGILVVELKKTYFSTRLVEKMDH